MTEPGQLRLTQPERAAQVSPQAVQQLGARCVQGPTDFEGRSTFDGQAAAQ
ncbi:hypothetical protein [Streptomyces ambofaciens]|uniref:hypothetical protein n=1 Tax=Streptomyces ambofaciens TaxID=1889 RepID=UPI001313F540|nr:hypothetical protein [Streptomyces ambofaciens]